MLDGPLMTAEEFLDSRFELPESGQWAELEAGRVLLFQPPDLDYGNTVLNLSKILAEYIQLSRSGYACFDLGLKLKTDPDTVFFPAACYFLTGERFAETDKSYTTRVPELAIELVSTSDRRLASEKRTREYLSWGIQTVWLIDPADSSVRSINQSGLDKTFHSSDTLTQQEILPEFHCAVSQLFIEPDWWSATPPKS